MTYREAVAHGEKVLELSHIADAKTDAWLLLEMGCKIDRKFYYMHMEDDLPDDLLKEYELAIKKRAEHIPLQYIVGETEFMGLKFKVNSNVLIPRQDTETLVEEALKKVKPGQSISVFIGPEGGFSEEEIELLRQDAEVLSLGKRILRTDTAAICTMSMLMLELEEKTEGEC